MQPLAGLTRSRRRATQGTRGLKQLSALLKDRSSLFRKADMEQAACEPLSVLAVSTLDRIDMSLAMLSSVAECTPGASLHLFLVDAPRAAAEAVEGWPEVIRERIDVFGPEELRVHGGTLAVARKYFNAFELCCLGRFIGMAHLLDGGEAGRFVVYMDNDTQVYADLRQVLRPPEGVDVILSPHIDRPTSDEEESGMISQGWVNAGFIAMRAAHGHSHMILEWLIDRISRLGFYAPERGLGAEQSWLTALPFVFPGRVYIEYHPGLNVAYWNLAQRELCEGKGGMEVNGSSLVMFHFSGFDGVGTERLSRHSNHLVRRDSEPVLYSLCRAYEDRRRAARVLGGRVRDFPRLASCEAEIDERILLGASETGSSVVLPGVAKGWFSRLGARLDLWLMRATDRMRRRVKRRSGTQGRDSFVSMNASVADIARPCGPDE